MGIETNFVNIRDIIQFIPFICAFYAFEFPLFNSDHNHEGDIMVIPSTMGTHEGNPLGGVLFALAHFRVQCFIVNYFSSYLFPCVANDMHIIGPSSLYHLHMNISKLNSMG
jgi:hypothetical protein